jgi:sec-independent protein translocase protein TatA
VTGALSPSHWVIILVVVLLLFGAKRLPDAARGLGRSMRILKAETTAMTGDDAQPSGDTATGDTTAGDPHAPNGRGAAAAATAGVPEVVTGSASGSASSPSSPPV